MIFHKSKSFRFVSVALTVTFTLSASTLIYDRQFSGTTQAGLDKITAETRHVQILKEVEATNNRTLFFKNAVVLADFADTQNLFTMAENAVTLHDPEGLESVALKLETFDTDNPDRKVRIENFKVKASDLFAKRARSRRYEVDKIDSKLLEIKSEIQSDPSNFDKTVEKNWLEKSRVALLDIYPRDAERAIFLVHDNFRAFYDLACYLQDKVGGSEKKDAIKYFEKVIEIGTKKYEKDADFLRANLNLTVLYFQIGNSVKAKCYSSQTMEKYLARNQDDLEYLLGHQLDGRWNEPEFIEALEAVNPNHDIMHDICWTSR
ncbi:MAG: hypothetical protein ACRD6X_10460 [Pyrinomonadaceae bacterium]